MKSTLIVFLLMIVSANIFANGDVNRNLMGTFETKGSSHCSANVWCHDTVCVFNISKFTRFGAKAINTPRPEQLVSNQPNYLLVDYNYSDKKFIDEGRGSISLNNDGTVDVHVEVANSMGGGSLDCNNATKTSDYQPE